MNRSTLRRFVLAGLLALVAASPAQAKKKPFGVNITVGGQSTSAGFSSVLLLNPTPSPEACE